MCAINLNKPRSLRVGSWLAGIALVLIFANTSMGQSSSESVQVPGSGDLSTARIKKDVKAKVEEMVGDIESNLIGELKGEITSMITSTIESYLNVSPASEVKNVIKVLKEGLSKEQKIVYQDYKVTYEWRKAHMDLTESLPDLYGKMHISERFKTAQSYLDACEQLRNAPLLSGRVPATIGNELKALQLKDIADRVRAATNTGSRPVWMSTADRIYTLKAASQDLDTRLETIKALHASLQQAYTQQKKIRYDQQWVKSVTRPTTVHLHLVQ